MDKIYDSGRFHNKETDEVTRVPMYENGPQPGVVSVDEYLAMLPHYHRQQLKLDWLRRKENKDIYTKIKQRIKFIRDLEK
jgi:hypothetical protein